MIHFPTHAINFSVIEYDERSIKCSAYSFQGRYQIKFICEQTDGKLFDGSVARAPYPDEKKLKT